MCTHQCARACLPVLYSACTQEPRFKFSIGRHMHSRVGISQHILRGTMREAKHACIYACVYAGSERSGRKRSHSRLDIEGSAGRGAGARGARTSAAADGLSMLAEEDEEGAEDSGSDDGGEGPVSGPTPQRRRRESERVGSRSACGAF